MLDFLKPAKHIERVPKENISSLYNKYRIEIFFSIFIGYAAFYLTRKTFSFVMPQLEHQGFTKGQLGIVLSAVSISYGFSNLLWEIYLTEVTQNTSFL